MHIEPGVLGPTAVALAEAGAVGLLGAVVIRAGWRPAVWLRAAFACVFFTACMQAFHVPVGPSELHFIGALPMYLALGGVPTLLGFAAGLLTQSCLFGHADLVNLGPNFLSLAVPLVGMHYALGRNQERIDVGAVLRLDAAYYIGVIAMVGLWLALGQVATPLADWARFAASYVSVMLLEPVLTLAVLVLLMQGRQVRWVRLCFATDRLEAGEV